MIRSGLRDAYLCVVLSGRLESHHGGYHLDSLRPGDLCGETEFLTSRERIAEVVACEPTTLLILPTEYLAQVIEKDAMIGRTLMKNLASRLAAQTAQRLDGLAGSVVHQSNAHSVELTTSSAWQRATRLTPVST
jgi:CRP-like cAMP-binding protein